MSAKTIAITVETFDLQQSLINLLGNKGPLTRGDMVIFLQIARTTIYDNLAKLITQNRVVKYPLQNRKRGHPKVAFKLK